MSIEKPENNNNIEKNFPEVNEKEKGENLSINKEKTDSIEEDFKKWKKLSSDFGIDNQDSQIEKEYKKLTEKPFSGGKYLGKKYPDLKKSEVVALSHEYSEEKEENEIDTWLRNVEAFHKRHRDNEEAMEIIKNAFYDQYVIKSEEVPESYFENQQRLMREQGHGNIEITDELKSQGIEVIINDQKSTLDNWTEYFFSEDADAYPMWAKYWALRSITKLSSYDKEKKTFGSRRKDTVAPFPDLNREAFAYVIDAIVKKAEKENIGTREVNPELEKIIQSENFGKLYAYAIEKVVPTEENELVITEGEWIKYDQNSDHMPLVESLQGYGTGWCTAGESTAQTQLQGGDFYVYYSKDKKGKHVIPRVAIRMQGNAIGEVRGIGPDQNLDLYINKVVDDKLEQFPDGEKYKKKNKDMKKLTDIEARQKRNEDLGVEDLRFLYEMDSKIEGFGYQRDPRIKEIVEKRDIKEDLSLITGFSKEEISITQKEALGGNIKYHYGDLYLSGLESAEGLTLPQSIGGFLNLSGLKSAEGLVLPQSIKGYLNLSGLKSAEGLVLPQSIERDLDLQNLKSAEGLVLPQSIKGYLNLSGLESAEGLTLPQSIEGYLNLSGLESAEGLVLPQSIKGYLNLSGLKSAEGLTLPQSIEGSLNLSGLESAEGLTLPQSIEGSLNLSGLESAEGLVLPQSIERDLDLQNLKSAEGLVLPQSIKGYLNLSGLESAEG
ncbi:MAG: hypothetical protein PHT67_01440, partial [Candidatus Pacebacteria bacterium]|nr:hypothetical protein [Candidatus Paceibacterota bacterium]